MAKAYRLTTARRKALRKAQLISARKRKGKGLSRKTQQRIGIVSAAALVGGAAYARHKLSGSSIHGPIGGITSTPMIKTLRGEKVASVPGTRAGLRVANYNRRDGFSMTLTARAGKREALLGGYRHKPLTMEGLKAVIGNKLRGGTPANVTGWNPRAARRKSPRKLDSELMRQINTRQPAFTKKENARRRLARRNSIGGAIARGRTISRIEAYRREREYIRIMATQGIEVNAAHKLAVGRAFLREFR